MIIKKILLIFSFFLSGCVSSKYPPQRIQEPVREEIPTKMLTVKIEPRITTQQSVINILGVPTSTSGYDANLYGENMDIIESHIGTDYEYNTCDMSLNEKARVIIKTELIDKNAPTLEYIIECHTGRKRLNLQFFDGKLNSYSFF